MIHYSDYVNPHVGSIGHLLSATEPIVALPNAMAQIKPLFNADVRDNFVAPNIFNFPLHATTVMADTEGNATFQTMQDHDFEDIRCYKGTMTLVDSDVQVEYTTTERCALYRFTFPKNEKGLLRFENASINKKAIEAEAVIRNVPYFTYAELSEAPESIEGTVCVFPKGAVVVLKAGYSYVSVEQAKINFAKEAADVDFDAAVENAQRIWDEKLGQIEVKGGTEKQKRIFYTALYRLHLRMNNINEYGKYYSSFDKAVHEDARPFYVNDGIWDTFRGSHPLQLILNPEGQGDVVASYLRMYEQSGLLPTFPFMDGSHPCMIGKHSSAMIADSYLKGVRNFDVETAWKAIIKNEEEMTKLPWKIAPANEYDECYRKNGFFPALPAGEEEWLPAHDFERRQCVAVTLENTYDEYCISALGKALGKADWEKYADRSQNYKNLYNKETGFMSPKTADGSWVPDFDPKLSGGLGGRAYFAECNSWTYTLNVQHDIEGLAQLMGGRAALEQYLDTMQAEQYGVMKYVFLGQFPDSTGLIGQFCMGNEPSFHIPYMYNYTTSPWKTQKFVRDIMRTWFDDTPLGICGDEDGGAMSAWYVFSAMGFYPTCPGKPEYDIGSPLFEEIKIHQPSGKTFTIVAEGNSCRAKYVQNIELNGQKMEGVRFDHQAIVDGGTLKLTMGEKPARK